MKLKRLRLKLTLLVGVIVSLLALAPLLLWRSARATAIHADLEAQAIDQMAQIESWNHTQQDGQPQLEFPAWYAVSHDDNHCDCPLNADVLDGVPVERWIREAGESPSFRTFNQDGVDYLGYVRPYAEAEGYVTVVETSSRDDALSSLRLRTLAMGVGLIGAAFGLGWVMSGLALGPARRAMADQQGFLADAAHEMRTPLAVILASSSQALGRPRQTEEYVRSLSEIRSAAERASAGVNELLDLVRFDSGQAIPRLAPLRLDLLAEEVAASVRPDECEVTSTPGEAVVVQADMALLRQAVENLVRNATRRCTAVELVAHVDGRDGVLEVLDNGPGFDPAVLPRVFDRYQRGDRRGDVGMGLAIVRAIVTAHGGSVDAVNRPEGGACVRVRVPLAPNFVRH